MAYNKKKSLLIITGSFRATYRRFYCKSNVGIYNSGMTSEMELPSASFHVFIALRRDRHRKFPDEKRVNIKNDSITILLDTSV